MNQPFWVLALCWIVFAGQAFLIVRFAERYVRAPGSARLLPTDDRLLGAVAAATGLVGVWRFAHGAPLIGLILIAVICTTLDFACCSDLRAQGVPAVLAIPVAALIGAADVVTHDWGDVIAGIAIMLPFAVAAVRSRGKATGYGDVALVGLGGFVLGLELGVLAIATACFVAAGVGFFRKRRGDALPFAPYLAVAIQGALLLPTLR